MLKLNLSSINNMVREYQKSYNNINKEILSHLSKFNYINHIRSSFDNVKTNTSKTLDNKRYFLMVPFVFGFPLFLFTKNYAIYSSYN